MHILNPCINSTFFVFTFFMQHIVKKKNIPLVYIKQHNSTKQRRKNNKSDKPTKIACRIFLIIDNFCVIVRNKSCYPRIQNTITTLIITKIWQIITWRCSLIQKLNFWKCSRAAKGRTHVINLLLKVVSQESQVLHRKI